MRQLSGRVAVLVALLVGLTAQAFGQSCGGGEVGKVYCNDAGTVPVALLVQAVNVALGTAECPHDPGAPNGRFEDTGLTVIDHQTGLEWEKKTGAIGTNKECPDGPNCNDPHHVNNTYTWSNSGVAFDGGAKTLFLDVLNDVAGGGTNCFAGHCDWRLPSSGGSFELPADEPAELESIVDCSSDAPCIAPIFGPTFSFVYWSSSTPADGPSRAWGIDFFHDELIGSSKTHSKFARAVRDGSLCGGGDLGAFYCNDAGRVPVALQVRAVNVALENAPCPTDPRRFEDTGLTVIDHRTGLEWEKKTGTAETGTACPGGANCADPNHVNNLYTWSNGGTEFDGSARTLFLDVLNDVAGGGRSCFADHCDWRLPTSEGNDRSPTGEPAELESIVDCSSAAPCIAPVFGPSISSHYWSSSTDKVAPWTVSVVSFENGSTPISGKPFTHYVRAVRGNGN